MSNKIDPLNCDNCGRIMIRRSDDSLYCLKCKRERNPEPLLKVNGKSYEKRPVQDFDDRYRLIPASEYQQ